MTKRRRHHRWLASIRSAVRGKSAMAMGVDAIFAAVADAGVEWKEICAATGGS